jgi:hypothetical protein
MVRPCRFWLPVACESLLMHRPCQWAEENFHIRASPIARDSCDKTPFEAAATSVQIYKKTLQTANLADS